MATDLGFVPDNNQILDWAEANPEIWGNKRGLYMFASEDAFKSEDRPHGAEKLSDIVDHWSEVAKRLKALEESQQLTTLI